jgi:micrococcal nuclease
MPRLAMLRLVVLLGILAILCVTDGLGLRILPASSRLFASGSGEFTLCSRGNQSRCVVDGDTIHYGGQKIRLEDIDAPETYQSKCSSELALGQRAKNRLLDLINSGPFEVVNRGGRDEDIYGRKLRTIERDGRSLGNILVAEGLARRWDGRRRSWCG